MTGKKKCPVCGLVQSEVLDCASCAASLVGVPSWREEALDETIDLPEDTDTNRPGAVTVLVAPVKSTNIILQGNGGKRIRASSGDILGRNETGAEYFADYPTVSRSHARIFYEAGQWVIEDTKSANGIFIDGKRVERANLRLGDSFSLSTACELTVASC